MIMPCNEAQKDCDGQKKSALSEKVIFFFFIIDFSFFMLIFVSDLCGASSPERRT
jgi:hypothetical protein